MSLLYPTTVPIEQLKTQNCKFLGVAKNIAKLAFLFYQDNFIELVDVVEG